MLQTGVSSEHALSSMVIPGVLPTYPPGNKFPCESIQLALVCACKVLRLDMSFGSSYIIFLPLNFFFESIAEQYLLDSGLRFHLNHYRVNPLSFDTVHS